MYEFLMIFSYFLIYSVIGWVIDTVDIYIQSKKLMNRGFLIGPYCPVYGVSCIIMLAFLKKYIDDPLILFIVAIFICTLTEYITSFILEKLFKARWWDYSHMPFNVNGRICLLNSILFGIGGIVLLYLLHPTISSVLTMIPKTIFIFIMIIILILFIIDVIISFNIISKLEKNINSIRKDSTEEIHKSIKEILKNSSHLTKRIIKVFPDFIRNFGNRKKL